MKTILALVTSVVALGFAVPSESSAWGPASPHSRIVSYLPCGRPVYANYIIHGYDRCGNPVGRWVTQREACGCHLCSPRPVCPPSYGRFGGHRHVHAPVVPVTPCAPRAGISWIFSFGR